MMNDMQSNNPTPNLIKQFSNPSKHNLTITFVGILTILLGIGTGILLNKLTSKNTSGPTLSTATTPNIKGEAGINDESTFKDTAQGELVLGGIEGEGMYHLVRPGGDSQNVYLTSTAVDLASFVGKKVQVWGQTLTAKTAGWLMDVGKIKII